MRQIRPTLSLLFVTGLATACDPGPTAPPSNDLELHRGPRSFCPDPNRTRCVDTSAILSVAVVDAGGPIFRTISVELVGPARLRVIYWSETSSPLVVASGDHASQHRVFLPRLKANTVYQYEIQLMGMDGPRPVVSRGSFSTDPLPPELSDLQIDVDGVATFPLVAIEIIRPELGADPIIVDRDGDIVWYRPGGGHSSVGFARLANGEFVINDDKEVVVVTPDNRVVAVLPDDADRDVHHDVTVTPRNTVLLLSHDDGLVDDTVWTGEAIWEWDPRTNDLTKRWSSFDDLSPKFDRAAESTPGDWLHANSLHVGPRGNVLVSLLWLKEVISIASDFESLEWRLGGAKSTFAVQDGAMDGGTHTAVELSHGRVLVFDNGRGRPDGTTFSRALEIRLSPATGVAQSLWEFRPQPDISAPFVSSARRLPNGNTVVAFGVAGDFGFPFPTDGPIAVFEVTTAKRVLWTMRLSEISILYRATPLMDIQGERELHPPPPRQRLSARRAPER